VKILSVIVDVSQATIITLMAISEKKILYSTILETFLEIRTK